MYRTLEQIPAYLVVMSLSMAGLKLVGHIPELTWLAVLTPVLLVPALAFIAVVLFGIALLVIDAGALIRTLFTRTTTPKE